MQYLHLACAAASLAATSCSRYCRRLSRSSRLCGAGSKVAQAVNRGGEGAVL